MERDGAMEDDVAEAALRGVPYTVRGLGRRYGLSTGEAADQIQGGAQRVVREAVERGRPDAGAGSFRRCGVPDGRARMITRIVEGQVRARAAASGVRGPSRPAAWGIARGPGQRRGERSGWEQNMRMEPLPLYEGPPVDWDALLTSARRYVLAARE